MSDLAGAKSVWSMPSPAPMLDIDRGPTVTVLVPACNEEAQIAETIESLLTQTRVPDTIVVVANNCKDATAERAAAYPVDVLVLLDNPGKKAGALNQALSLWLPRLSDDDAVLVMDADSSLDSDFVRIALERLPQNRALSGAYVSKPQEGLLRLVQKVEYAQERRRIARRQGRVNVLSGAASVFTAGLLRQVAALRPDGQVYDERSLTEDFELTLAVMSLGVKPLSPKVMRVETDLMATLGELYGQRLRWQRGYLETLAKYPFRDTWHLWLRQLGVYAGSLLPFLVLSLTAFVWAQHGVHVSGWAALTPVFLASEVVGARAAGRRGMWLAAAMLPLSIFNVFRGFVYWRALGHAIRARESAWT